MMTPKKQRRFLELVALTFALSGSAGCWTRPGSPLPGAERERVLTVEGYYPGATTDEVVAAVAVPIEECVKGTEQLTRLRSRAAVDGTYLLELSFASGFDLEQTMKRIQDRLGTALPGLPESVTTEGLKLLKPRPLTALAILTLSSPVGRHDQQHLRDFADRILKDELARLPGVYHLQLFGAFGLANAKPRDGTRSLSTLNGKPIVGIAVYPNRGTIPEDLSDSLRDHLAQIKTRLPEGIRLELDFDFTPNIEAPDDRTTPEYLLVELHFPAAASVDRISRMLNRCETILRQAGGVQDILASTEPILEPGHFPASVLVRLAASPQRKMPRAKLIAEIRTRLKSEIRDSLIRVRDLSGHSRFPSCSYPIEFALVDTENRGYVGLRDLSERLADKLRNSPGLTDAMASPGAIPLESVSIEVDLNKAQVLHLDQQEIVRTLQDYFGARDTALKIEPATLRMTASPLVPGREIEELSSLEIRGSDSRMVPLQDVARIRPFQQARLLERLDGLPMVEITSDYSPDIAPADARARCARVIKEFEVPVGYRLRWLSGKPESN
jgi:multidrug efflux pump subunit AcrB